MVINSNVQEMGARAKQAGRALGLLSASVRNAALMAIADALEQAGSVLYEANEIDVRDAKAAGVAPALVDRSILTPKRLASMVVGCRDTAGLADPLGQTFDGRTMANGLRLTKKRVPLGVLAVIFESRPNVTIDISVLAIKTGNAVIMRGGKESLRTNKVLIDLVRGACRAVGVPADAVQLIRSTDRSLVSELLAMDEVIDLVIPRGGPGLQALVKKHATMPVVYGGIGVCHLFVDGSADVQKCIPLINNAKTQAPSVCNALDTVLVHREVAAALLPPMVDDLVGSGVRVYCDEDSMGALGGSVPRDGVVAADEDHFGREFLSLALSVKVVDSLDQGIEHIEQYGTHHSDGILTNDFANAMAFCDRVDSAAVYVNASTRFTDGGQFGLGAEVAISTQRMHARGPLGLQELTTYKWVAHGDYTVRS